MPKIKITEPGMESYTGFIGEIEFNKGVSVEELSVREVQRVGAAMACRVLDKDGNEGKSASPAQVLLDTQDRATAVDTLVDPTERPAQSEQQQEQQQEQPQAQPQANAAPEEQQSDEEKGDEQKSDDQGAGAVYSRADLEAIADKEGISGLRNIGVKFGVRSNSITGLIDGILEAQSKQGA